MGHDLTGKRGRALAFQACLLVALLLVSACASRQGGSSLDRDSTPGPGPTAPSIVAPRADATPARSATPDGPFEPRVRVVATGLEIPWALAFAARLPGADGGAPAGPYLLVTERPGRLRLIAGGQLQPAPLATLPVASAGEGGLMGLALDPGFQQNGRLYVMYTYRDGGGLRNRISRLTLQGGRAGNEMALLEGIPGASIHDGGRIAFGPDGKLYAGTGDASQRELAQRLDSPAGKILRLNPDGSIPADNPFPGSAIYSYGHRNPQGLAWQPGTDRLFSTEHGPSGGGAECCHDEVNRIQRGANYGWPVVFGAAGDPRFVDPVRESGTDTWAPGGAAFYDGSLLSPWKGSLFFGALRGEHLHRLALGGPTQDQVVAEEELFDGIYGRIRDVAVGPDGALYFTTSNRDGRGRVRSGDDHILRLAPGFLNLSLLFNGFAP